VQLRVPAKGWYRPATQLVQEESPSEKAPAGHVDLQLADPWRELKPAEQPVHVEDTDDPTAAE